MGRYSTGAATTDESIRLELSYLLKSKILQKGAMVSGILSWTSGANVSYLCKYGDDEAWIHLRYTHTDNHTGNKTDYDYRIEFERKVSNLGRGEVLYFICPESGRTCRKLYMAYGYPKFKSRQAYSNRIYYPDQLSSKMDRPNDRYWRIKRQLEKKNLKHHRKTYKGNLTKSEMRLRSKRDKMNYYDSIRWNINFLPLALRNTFDQHGGDVGKMVMF